MKRAQPLGSELDHLTVMDLSLSGSAITTVSSACRLGIGCSGKNVSVQGSHIAMV